MKYFLVHVSDGGADIEEMTEEAIDNHLSSNLWWREALKTFRNSDHVPGLLIDYPCGWIFIATERLTR